jgi:glycosyltransferase involved in cell wall biosynthesis
VNLPLHPTQVLDAGTVAGPGARVCLVANTDWYLYNFRRDLAQFLRARGLEVVLISSPGPYVEKLQALGFRWLPWQVGRQTMNPLTEAAALMRLMRLYKAERPALVHHHTIKPALYGTLAARWSGVPAIINSITGRGYLFLGQDTKVRSLRTLIKKLYRHAFDTKRIRAIFENATDYQYFIDNGLITRDRARMIESVGVEPARFFHQAEPGGAPVILMAARMLWDKGAGVLVDAARLLHERTKVRVALAGAPDPGNPASIPAETLQKWHDDGIIEWWGFQDDMNAAYAKSHIVTLPTNYAEGLPTSLIEAAACGRPIVATTIPGCKDFITEGYNGFLVPPNDPVALADALERLATNPDLRKQVGMAARTRVMEKYTTGFVNSATLQVYRELFPL